MPETANAAESLRGRRVVLGVTGGIAAYKAAFLVRLLRKSGAEVAVVMTEAAGHFITPLTLATLSGRPVVTSLWEPVMDPQRASDVEHIGLVKWADWAVMAPATMNSLGKLALGLADDAVSTFFSAYDPARTLLAPAMNGGMWRNPATRANLDALRARGHAVVGPGSGDLACGDEDEGRLAEPEEILAALAAMAGTSGGRLAGRRVLVSAGPTRERLDPVRFLGNPSTGSMGLSLAEAARREGAAVTLVAGPGVAPSSPGIERVDVESAAQMTEALLARAAAADLTFMAAAVADWRPREISPVKLKKGAASLRLELEPTPDILTEMARRGVGGFRVGFALETEDLEARAREKLERKQLRLVIGNLAREGKAFGDGLAEVVAVGPAGFRREFPAMDKRALGAEILRLAVELAGEAGKAGAGNA